MITTTYTCDRCHKTVDQGKLASVWIRIGDANTSPSWAGNASNLYNDTHLHLCDACRKEMQLRNYDRKQPITQPPRRTAEDVLIELAEMLNLKFEE